MKRKNFFAVCTFLAVLTAFCAAAEEGASKVIAIGDVDAGYDISGQRAYDVKETIQIGLKKEIEKQSKGQYTVKIVSPAVVTAGKEAEPSELPELPTDRAPTQKEMAKYMAAMQQMQKEMTGQVKKHKPVAADAYFDLRVSSGQSGMDTGGAASTIGYYSGINTHVGDMSTKTTKVYLTATQRDPRTGELIDKHTAKASSVKFRNVGGFTSYDYGSDEMQRESLFKPAIKDCAKWILSQVK